MTDNSFLENFYSETHKLILKIRVTRSGSIISMKIIAVIYTTFAFAKKSQKKNSGLYGIRTLDLCDTGAVL